MRETANWRRRLTRDLELARLPDTVIPRHTFCQIELGLRFLSVHFPGEPIGVLQAVLSGYLHVPQELIPVIRKVRHRMGDTARRGYWRRLLNLYMRVPDAMRAFDRLDDPARRVKDQTVFTARPTSIVPDRIQVYDDAMTDALEYATPAANPVAEAGRRYAFSTSSGRETVVMPTTLPTAPAYNLLHTSTGRQRQSFVVDINKDLRSAAETIDERLASRPDITNRNWVKRLADLRFSTFTATGAVDEAPVNLGVDGIEHWVGLPNSGKTTLCDLITFHRVEVHGDRGVVVVGSVADVFEKVKFLRAIGIDAVPLIGHSSKGEHAGRYWRSMVEESSELFPSQFAPVDPAAAYANTSCLLEIHRSGTSPDWKPLSPNEFPCRARLSDTESGRTHDCPLISVCPSQKAIREVATAQVWVTTPQCLLTSRAEPSTASMRWLEQIQHNADFMFIDEVDAVQQVFDTRFVQTEALIGAGGGKGWTFRMNEHTSAGLDRQAMAQTTDPAVSRWHEYLQIHSQATFALNRLALSPDGAPLHKLLGGATFTAHALLRRTARTLHELPDTGEGDKAAEDAADDFYRARLQDIAEQQPDRLRDHELYPVIAELTSMQRDDTRIQEQIDRWLDEAAKHAGMNLKQLEPQRKMLRLLIEAAVFASRITTSFFEMVTLYPSVRDKLDLPDEERFWLDQPPRDYRALVPEAPMGNILALRWAANRNGGASLQLLWVHGVGRWLLHHAHDLISPEGVDGPNVVLTSATSWTPGSSFYHVPIEPSLVLRQPEEDRDALYTSTLLVQAARQRNGDPIYVSGRHGGARDDALRQMVTAFCEPAAGRLHSAIDDLRGRLPEGRQQVLLVVLSGRDARVVSEAINNKTSLTARHIVPDAADPGDFGLARRRVGQFGRSSAEVLVAAEMAIQRGYNILNRSDTAALGAVIYLSRSHPPPFDLAFPLSLLSERAMRILMSPPQGVAGEFADIAAKQRRVAAGTWFDLIGRPLQFSSIPEQYRAAFVANNLVPMSQTIGRSIRGNQPTNVWLADAAFADRLARQDKASDTERTSLVVATDRFLVRLLERKGDRPDQKRLSHINESVWGLLGHLMSTSQPLGSRRNHVDAQ